MPLVKPEVAYAYYQRANSVRFVAAAAAADDGDSNALSPLSPTRNMERRGHEVQYVSYVNSSGGTVVAAIAGRLRQSEWVAGQLTAAGVYTADTTDAQDAGTADFNMHDRTDEGSGFLVGANIPWNVLGVVVSAAGDQVVPVRTALYWNGAAWTDIQSSLLIGVATDNLLQVDGTGEKVQLFDIPNNWAVGGTPVATVPQSTYNMQFLLDWDTLGTADPTASQMFVGVARFIEPALTDNANTLHDLSVPVKFPRECDALFGVCDADAADVYFNIQHRFYW